jgi:hypothetical protein
MAMKKKPGHKMLDSFQTLMLPELKIIITNHYQRLVNWMWLMLKIGSVVIFKG